MSEPDSSLTVVRDVASLRRRVKVWHGEQRTVALVPTMGALHAGHMALVKRAKALADAVVVSIFVNPTQFGPNEDLDAYPRRDAEDWALLNAAGVDLIFMPDASVMYPDGFQTAVQVPAVSQGLCGTHRPGHFEGVATVVTKLLLQGLPDLALFGEKDFQQLAVIKRLVIDLDIPVDVLSVPTVRERDGLALSSRNAYLSEDERAIAPKFYATLSAAAAAIANGADIKACCAQAERAVLAAGFSSVDYIEVRVADSLLPLKVLGSEARILGAATLGQTRLIDNVKIPAQQAGG
ncbi:MAG: pantoate--beta-alanine ligase [Rhodospirillaceae bacterium]|nr:pantoate--beta-alanine ligase [Rhodospirillaceae bacterium]